MIPLAENSYKDDVNEFLDSSVNITPVKYQINQGGGGGGGVR